MRLVRALLDTIGIKSRSENRVIPQRLDHRAVVRLTYDAGARQWLLSAYEVNGEAPPPADYRGAGETIAQDRSPAREANGNIAAFAGKYKLGEGVASPSRLWDARRAGGRTAQTCMQ